MVASLREKLRDLRHSASPPQPLRTSEAWLQMRSPAKRGQKPDHNNPRAKLSKPQRKALYERTMALRQPVYESQEDMAIDGWMMDHSRDERGQLTAALPLGYDR